MNGGASHSQVTNRLQALPAPEPIAVCGIALRLPGGIHSTEAFWDVLHSGKDLRSTIPPDRFDISAYDASNGKKGAIATHHGYFLSEDLAHFDASFFNMSKLEAEKADPQQRKLLEVTRECLENAGETDYRGKLVGCFVGTFGDDWLQLQSKENQFTGGYNLLGGDLMIANRVSYEFDFQGPSMVIKTGCSASLVGLHEACRALQSGDCTSALVAGTSLIMGPSIYAAMTSEGVLSADGSCKAFDAAADGFARADGINAVYLKRLGDAVRDGNPVRAVIRNTGTNSDGKSLGLLSPRSSTQESLMRKVYVGAGLDPMETAFVECHGTGTATGDPIETTAIGNVFGQKGVYIGSVKPNVGHSEGASGLTSLIKCILALEHKTIPPNIKFSSPNPKIPFQEKKLMVPLVPTSWPQDRAERISINSFGIGGSNAHVVIDSAAEFLNTRQVEDEPKPPAAAGEVIEAATTSSPRLLLFSANTADSLKQLSQNCLDHVKAHQSDVDSLAYTLSQRRELLPHRSYAVVPKGGPAGFIAPAAKAPLRKQPLIMVFSGQGAQWPQMGKQLIENDPLFAQDFREMDDILASLRVAPRFNMLEELLKPDGQSQVYKAELSQPLCTAIQIGLVNALGRLSIRPDAVIGHSSGEIAAAYAAGLMTVREALAISYLRGFATSFQTQLGGMAAIGLNAGDVTSNYLAENEGVVVAAENSPQSTTISGDVKVLERVLRKIRDDRPDVLAQRLQVDMAYHSHHMNEIGHKYLELLREELGGTAITAATDANIPLFSTVTEQTIQKPIGLEYWVRNLTSPVKFNAASRLLLSTLSYDGSSMPLFLEIGPHSQMGGPLHQVCTAARAQHTYIPTMLRAKDCVDSFLSAVGQLFQHGIPLGLASGSAAGGLFTSDSRSNKVLASLEPYPWDHSTRYWYENRVSHDWRFRAFGHHELLGQRIPESTSLEPAWRVVLDLEDVPWLHDHKVRKDVVFPFAGYVAMAGEAIRQQVSGVEMVGYSVKHVVVHTALVLVDTRPVELVTTLCRRRLTDRVDSEYWDFTIASYSGDAWVKHCEGSVKALEQQLHQAPNTMALDRKLSAPRWYEIMARVGLVYGPSFQGIDSLEASPMERRAIGGLRETVAGEGQKPFVFHPTTMDACFQLVIAAGAQGLSRNLTQLSVPTLIEEMDVYHHTADRMIAEAWVGPDSADVGILCMSGGQVALRVKGARLSPLDNDGDVDADRHKAARLEWHPDLDFLDAGSLFDAPVVDNATKLTMEEIVLLCLLDSAERVQGLEPAQPHYHKFREWLCRERTRAVDGAYPLIDDAQRYTTLSREQRVDEIEQRLTKISADPKLRLVTRGVYRVYDNIEALFTGRLDTLELLLKDNVLTEIYNSISFGFSRYTRLLCISQPRLRILEVGAGTGGTTELLLRDLVGDNSGSNPPYSEYTFTDISAGFFPRAEARFAYAPNMEYKTFDISRDPLEQGFVPGSYDLILAANVVHATENLQVTLRNLHPLLSPGGRLVLSEVCATAAKAIGYVFGNFAGWWLGEGDGRLWEPYIQVDRWDRELKAAGFTGVDTSVLDAEEPYQYCAAIVTRPMPAEHVQKRLLGLGAVTVLCDDPGHKLPAKLISELETRGLDVTVARFGAADVDWLPLPADRPILVTVDLESYFFQDITAERLASFQDLCRWHNGEKLLWLMPPTQIRPTDPRHAQSIGALRISRQELGLPFFTLEISESEKNYTDLVLSVLQKVCRSDDVESLAPDREFAVDGGIVKIARCKSFSLKHALSVPVGGQGESASSTKRLNIGKPGLLETLRWVSTEAGAEPLRDGEVEIETRADIMVAMGIIPFGSSSPQLGVELSGIVTRVGSGVEHVGTGDRVVAVATDGCFSTLVVIESSLVVKIPDSLSLDDAATMPTVFATALQSLVQVGRTRKGQTVLIHSACGGIGHAAVQLCQNIGAEVFVTVGSETKVEYAVQNMGIARDHIFNSHDTSFLDDVMRQTGGRGVDVVLNSLSGALLHASWACVAEFGTLVELGKRDLVGFGHLDLEPFLKNRSYCCVDLAHMIKKRPTEVGRLVREVIDLFMAGKIRPITARAVFEAGDVELAFRHLQKDDHIGKAIVRMPARGEQLSVLGTTDAAAAAVVARPLRLDPRASYLLTGGLGGLGRSVASWMVEHGARNIVFLSRSAGMGERDQPFLRELAAMGCKAIAVPGQVQAIEDVQCAIDLAPSPIKGVVHLAMVLRDSPAVDLTHEEWTSVIQPKVDGAWNLHNAFMEADQPLDFFLMTSSIITIIDQPGQSNYAAANTFLEAFCQYRRGLGLPAATLSICPVDDVGFVADNKLIRKKLMANGIYFLPERETLDYFQLAIANQLAATGAELQQQQRQQHGPWASEGYTIMGLHSQVHLEDPKCATSWRRDRRRGTYHNARNTAGASGAERGSGGGLKTFLEQHGRDNPGAVLERESVDYIATEIGHRIFQFMMKDAADMDLSLTVMQIGMDSLMAIELRRWWKQTFGLDVSVLEIMGAGTLQQLGELAANGLKTKLAGE